ncbi:GNAT family N-acetyltransferase [Flavobacterium zepuense]|uniref:GNAT family N-acetyltransferase n=1 Tax=Flavobacterium zepuense TaxID=2593302 RepID=A0A552V7V7_9FLAO|nr:GNAT family N-acetyltransferase [Flavobacterium zepuense]TRW26551.1 GNAT family N-acetyltransferase [Flavobacterium zepuense]
MPVIKQITSQQTFVVRQPVLRPGKALDTCIFDGDDLPATIHFGVFEEEGLLGVISVFKASHDFFTEADQYQIRGMAVLENQQKKGLGDLLVQAAEQYISQQNGKKIWFNAREIAVGFYKKMGYAVTGEPFTIGDIGIHYVMHKTL